MFDERRGGSDCRWRLSPDGGDLLSVLVQMIVQQNARFSPRRELVSTDGGVFQPSQQPTRMINRRTILGISPYHGKRYMLIGATTLLAACAIVIQLRAAQHCRIAFLTPSTASVTTPCDCPPPTTGTLSVPTACPPKHKHTSLQNNFPNAQNNSNNSSSRRCGRRRKGCRTRRREASSKT